MVRPGADGADDLLGLGRREDELDVGRRLLDHLQQGVEPRIGDHVRLVDDVDLVAAVHRREEGPLAQVTRLVDAAVGGRVDLDDVDAPRAAARQVAAALTHPARRRGGALLTVEATRQDARRRRLATAPRPAEQVGVADPIVDEGALQRLGDVILADHLLERLGTVAPIQSQWRLRGWRDRLHDGRLRARPRELRRRGNRRFIVVRTSGHRCGVLHRTADGQLDERVGHRRLNLGFVVGIDRNLVHLVEINVHLRVVDGRRLGGQDQFVGFHAEQVGTVLLIPQARVGRLAEIVLVEEPQSVVVCHTEHPTWWLRRFPWITRRSGLSRPDDSG